MLTEAPTKESSLVSVVRIATQLGISRLVNVLQDWSVNWVSHTLISGCVHQDWSVN